MTTNSKQPRENIVGTPNKVRSSIDMQVDNFESTYTAFQKDEKRLRQINKEPISKIFY